MEVSLSSKLRQAFIAEPGTKLVVADLSQIEPRLTAHYAASLFPGKERSCPLLSIFLKGLDLYAVIANNILELGVPESELTKKEFKKKYPEYREFGKVLQLATTYGLGPDKLAWKLNKISDKKYQYKDAKNFILKFWDSFWDIKALRKSVQDEVLNRGYLETLFGRKVYLSPAEAAHKGVNYKIQGPASDICLFTQLWVQEQCEQACIPSDLLMLVHDEAVYQIYLDFIDNFKLLLETVMTKGWHVYRPDFNLLVPLEIDIEVGDSWACKG